MHIYVCIYVYLTPKDADLYIYIFTKYSQFIHRIHVSIPGFEYFLYRYPVILQNCFLYVLIFKLLEKVFFSPYNISLRMRSTKNGISRKII